MAKNIIYKNQEGDKKLVTYLASIMEGASREAITAFQKKEITEDTLAKLMLPYIRRVIKSVWRTYPGLNERFEPGDFESNVWLLCRRWLTENFDSTRPLTPVVRKLVVNTLNDAVKAQSIRPTLVMAHINDELDHFESYVIEKSNLANVLDGDDFASINVGEIDSILATRKVCQIIANRNNMNIDKSLDTNVAGDTKMKMPGFSKPIVTTNHPDAAPVQAKRRDARGKATPALSMNQKKLNDILNKLGWTHGQFASELNIGNHTLDSYLYGKTKDVPKDVMLRAVSIEKEEKKNPAEKYHGKHMKDILKSWCKLAEVDYDDNKSLSVLCRVSIPTITRWKNGVSRPSPADIRRAEASLVEFIAAKDKFKTERANMMAEA